MGELMCSRKDELEEAKTVTLYVITIASDTDVDNAVLQIKEAVCDGIFILDVDLDYFSTANPFLAMYTKQQFETLSRLYSLKVYNDLDTTIEKRKEQIEWLEAAIKKAVSLQGEPVGADNSDSRYTYLPLSVLLYRPSLSISIYLL